MLAKHGLTAGAGRAPDLQMWTGHVRNSGAAREIQPRRQQDLPPLSAIADRIQKRTNHLPDHIGSPSAERTFM